MDLFEAGYTGLFVVSFLSATILPLSSEGILLLMLGLGYNPLICLIIASSGNILGGSTNYLLGRLGNPLWLKKFGMTEARLLKFETQIQKYGFWTAFLSWVPFIGDPLIVALGFFRTSFVPVFICMSLGKIVRYLVLILPFIL